jgi:hypothetical protein
MHDLESRKLQKECFVRNDMFNVLCLCFGFFFIGYEVCIFIKGNNRLGTIVYTNFGAACLAYIIVFMYATMCKSKFLSSTARSRTQYTVFLPFFAQLPCWLYMLISILSCMLCRVLYRSVDWFWPELLSLCISNLIISVFSISLRHIVLIACYFSLLVTLPIPLNRKLVSVYALPAWMRSTSPALFVCAGLIVLTAVLAPMAAAYAYKKR